LLITSVPEAWRAFKNTSKNELERILEHCGCYESFSLAPFKEFLFAIEKHTALSLNDALKPFLMCFIVLIQMGMRVDIDTEA